jgi:hypothetical protein
MSALKFNMKSKWPYSIVLFAVIFCTMGSLAASIGRVDSFEGAPYVLRNFKKLPLTVGFELELKDNLYTKAGATVLMMEDGSEINLGPDSHFKVKNYVTTGSDIQRDVLLFDGSSRFKVRSLSQAESFTVRSPTSVAGVRGTDFNVGVQGEQTTVTVFSGLVACYSVQAELGGQPELVGAGFASTIEKNKSPQSARKMSPKQIKALKSSTATKASAEKEASADGESSETDTDGSGANGQGTEGDKGSAKTPGAAITPTGVLESVQGDIIQNTIEQVQERVIEDASRSSSIFNTIRPIAPPTTKE